MGDKFLDVLAGFAGAAGQTTIEDRGHPRLKGEYHLELKSAEFESDSNQYGPFVKATLGWNVCDPGDDQDTGVQTMYFINTTKDGKLSFGGQDIVRLAGIIAGEPIADNNPVQAVEIIRGAVGSVIKGKCFPNKKGYQCFDPKSLEAAVGANA